MFARIVPALRTPVGVDVFDYKQPSDCRFEPGDLVQIPFRRQTVTGLVVSTSPDSQFAAKAATIIGSYGGIRFPKATVDLLSWVSERTFTSQPSVLKSWLRSLPKKPGSSPNSKSDHPGTVGGIVTHWICEPERQLLQDLADARRKGKRVLVLTPWVSRAIRLQQAVPNATILHGELNDGDAFRAWSGFCTGTSDCLITTRLGAWLSPIADLVLLDEPENDDHKQDDSAPRYDTRLMLGWCAKFASTMIRSYGRTPPLHVTQPAPTIPCPLSIHIRHPQGRSSIPMVQGDTLNRLRHHEGPRLIIHPIKGFAARLVCRDCGWRATCPACGFDVSQAIDHAICKQCGKKSPLPVSCLKCGSSDLGKSWPGIEKLKLAWQKSEPEIVVEWRDLSNEAMDAPLPQNVLVAITDAALLGGGGEDIRRRERQGIAFRRLADRIAAVHGELIIQCEERLATIWPTWLTTEGVAQIHDEERGIRRLFGYPPTMRVVKAIVTGTGTEAQNWLIQARKSLEKSLPANQLPTYRGPFEVAFRSTTQGKRMIWHLLFAPETSEATLIRALTPLASSAMIDLDPIAFFR